MHAMGGEGLGQKVGYFRPAASTLPELLGMLSSVSSLNTLKRKKRS